MRRLSAWLLVALALGGASASAAAGALGLGLRRKDWPLAAVLIPEAAGWAALPAVAGVALAALARGLARHDLPLPASATARGDPPVAGQDPTGVQRAARAAAGLSLGAAALAGWPLLALPLTAARWERSLRRLLESSPALEQAALRPSRPEGRARGSAGGLALHSGGSRTLRANSGAAGWDAPALPLLRTLAQAYRPHSLGASRSERGIVYHRVDGQELALDLYRPLGRGSHPLVVAIHGGGWYTSDRRELPAFNRYLAGRGYAVAAVDYRLAPAWTYPAPLEDVQAAVGFLADHATEYDLDPERAVLVGRSAGGHLALMAAYADAAALGGARVAGVAAYYPPTDLATLARTPAHDGVFTLRQITAQLVGADVDLAPERFQAASPLAYAARPQPPTLLVHGARDALVPAAQSRALAVALARAGNPVAYLELPWSAHGFDFPFRGLGHALALHALTCFLAWATHPSRPPRSG